MSRALTLLAVLGVLACRGSSDKPAPTPAPTPSEPAGSTFDPMLVAALCLVSLTPEGPGSGHTVAGVVTNGKVRRPWFARTYDARFTSVKTVEDALFLIHRPEVIQGLLPNTVCPPAMPAYISIEIYNATEKGKDGTWIIAGDLTAPNHEFIAGTKSTPDPAIMAKLVGPVADALGGSATIARFPTRPDVQESGIDGRWEDAFRDYRRP
jgi:hypothetical protein